MPLGDENLHPTWLEHPNFGWQVDVVAIPLGHLKTDDFGQALDYVSYPRDGGPGQLNIANDVLTVGFPIGFDPINEYAFPIWTRGSIAWPPRLDWNEKPAFFIDSRGRQGQSGSPVIFSMPMRPCTSSPETEPCSVAPLGVCSACTQVVFTRTATSESSGSATSSTTSSPAVLDLPSRSSLSSKSRARPLPTPISVRSHSLNKTTSRGISAADSSSLPTRPMVAPGDAWTRVRNQAVRAGSAPPRRGQTDIKPQVSSTWAGNFDDSNSN